MTSASTFGDPILEIENANDSIYKLYIPRGDPDVEIIFFHDIMWEGCKQPHVESWMSSTKPLVCWAKDWLSCRYPQARILSAYYDAALWKTETTGQMTLDLLAENLRQDILSASAKTCPIFLVGHGLGGLVIKALIRDMQRKRDDLAGRGSTCEGERNQLGSFLEKVKGIMYFNTPFLGTVLADRTKHISTRGSMLDSLHILDRDVACLNEWFRKWRNDRLVKTRAIFANGLSKVPFWYRSWRNWWRWWNWWNWSWWNWNWSWWKWWKKEHVVKEASSRYDVDNVYTSSRDHFSVCKLRDTNDSSFLMLTELINSEINKSTQGLVSPLEHSKKNLCKKYATGISRRLQKLKAGEGLFIPRNDTQLLREFPDLYGDVKEELTKAGLTLKYQDAQVESWEPVCKRRRVPELISKGTFTCVQLD